MEDAIKKSMFLSVAGLAFAAGADVTEILLSGFGTAVDALLAVQALDVMLLPRRRGDCLPE